MISTAVATLSGKESAYSPPAPHSHAGAPPVPPLPPSPALPPPAAAQVAPAASSVVAPVPALAQAPDISAPAQPLHTPPRPPLLPPQPLPVVVCLRLTTPRHHLCQRPPPRAPSGRLVASEWWPPTALRTALRTPQAPPPPPLLRFRVQLRRVQRRRDQTLRLRSKSPYIPYHYLLLLLLAKSEAARLRHAAWLHRAAPLLEAGGCTRLHAAAYAAAPP